MKIGTDEGLLLVDRIMDRLGFRRDSGQRDPSGAPRQLSKVRYLDADGNEVGLHFSLHLSPQGSGIATKAVFNKTLSRTWHSLENMIDGIGQTVGRWKQTHADRAVPGQASSEKSRTGAAAGSVVSGGRRFIDGKAFAGDVRAGLDDAALMQKYRVSQARLLSLLARLVWEGLLTPEDVEERKSLSRTVYMAVYQCRLCKRIMFDYSEQCPDCGGPIAVMNRKDSDFG
ncbi:MAG: hypothetical protein HY914_13725 [Desulfomonile tiedjei]|nr:hypothetical protein [Desulfomonile tiedjei]